MKLYVLDGGMIDILNWDLYAPGAGPAVRRRLADPAYLIVHQHGTLVWDTGLSDELAARPGGLRLGDHAVFQVEKTIEAQLADVGQSAALVDYLALSHFHPDHIGNAGLFASARLLVQREEYQAAFGPGAEQAAYELHSSEPLLRNPVEKLDGDHDVFGDGSVVIKRFPGHTPGHQALLVRLPKTGPVLISGDLAHSRENWESRTVPSLNSDAVASHRSIEAAAQLLEAKGAALWIQHDLGQYQGLRLAPEYYE